MLKQMIKSVPMVQRRCLYSPSTSLTELGPTRRLFSTSNGDDTKVLESIANVRNSNEGVSATKRAPSKLCQINNHPDFRLKQAKARLAKHGSISGDISTITDTHNITTPIVIENKVRSNDGTSSGALVEDRLRLARRKALENASQPIKQPSSSKVDNSIVSKSSSAVKTSTNIYYSIENPVRSNDGTSSGAVTADRLRLARRKALEAASHPIK